MSPRRSFASVLIRVHWRSFAVVLRLARPLPLRLALSAAVALLPACQREAPKQSPPAQTASPPPNAAAKGVGSDPGADIALIPTGRFLMGDKAQADAPPHQVAVSSFYMDKYLVTQEQYQRVMSDNPSRWKGTRNPVEQVRWSDAARYCNARSKLAGLEPCYDLKSWQCNFAASGYRLPTEAEWEYACRAGATTAYYFGDSPAKLGDYAWFDKNSGGHPRPVGQKQPNAWGLYDMCGNLWQWCQDSYQVDYYKDAPPADPRGPAQGQAKVVRGGAWRFNADCCRSGYRYNENPGYADVCFGYDIYGFRCVRNGPPADAAANRKSEIGNRK